MAEFPHSPEEVIDPRWNRYLHPQDSHEPALRGQARDGNQVARPAVQPAQHGVQPARHASDAELNAEIAAALEPWRTGRSGPRETLEALRDLAERML
jgi:hypothetical protein